MDMQEKDHEDLKMV